MGLITHVFLTFNTGYNLGPYGTNSVMGFSYNIGVLV